MQPHDNSQLRFLDWNNFVIQNFHLYETLLERGKAAVSQGANSWLVNYFQHNDGQKIHLQQLQHQQLQLQQTNSELLSLLDQKTEETNILSAHLAEQINNNALLQAQLVLLQPVPLQQEGSGESGFQEEADN